MPARLSFRFQSRPSQHHSAAGFSLVEVVMALGILSFCLVTTLGLMSVGLRTMRDAMDTTTGSLIVQQIASQARFAAYTNLDAQFSEKTFYFDEEGSFLTNSPASAPVATRYLVKTSLTNAVFPGSTNAMTQNPLTNSVRTLSIQVGAASPNVSFKAATQLNLLIPNSGD